MKRRRCIKSIYYYFQSFQCSVIIKGLQYCLFHSNKNESENRNRKLNVCSGGMPAGVSGVSGVLQVVDSPLLKQQIDVQRLAIKQLKSENYRLKVCV